MDDLDRRYYLGREAACRRLAAQAADRQIGRIHIDLADAYAEKAGLAGESMGDAGQAPLRLVAATGR